MIELSGGRALPVSLEVLGQARRLSTALGATLYATVALPQAPRWSKDDVLATLAACGADKIIVTLDERLSNGEELRWDTHGHALTAVCALVSPSLLLFGLTPAAREVAARLAARLGAAYLYDAWIEVERGALRLFEGEGATARALDGDLEFAVVATIPAGRYRPARGGDEAEVELLSVTAAPPVFTEVAVAIAPPPAAIVVAEPTAGEAAALLARALGGAVVPDMRGARLAVTLGPPCPRAERRVRLGSGPEDADYVVAGEPVALANSLARALGRRAG